MASPKVDLYAAMLEKAKSDTLASLGGVPESLRLRQIRAGGATPLWLAGHLANTINTVILRWILREPSCLSREESMMFAPDFAGGTPPSSDASQYPAWDAVLEKYNEVMSKAVAGVKTLDDAALDEALNEKIPDVFRSRFLTVDATLMQMVSHDAYHRGQVGLLGKE